MLIRICAITDKGWELANLIEERMEEDLFERKGNESLEDFFEESFQYHLPIVFIGAAGIAVRKIAPFIENKLVDSCVIVIDESGQYVVPILSGHVGQGNNLANIIADSIGGKAVITTATDVNEKFSVDCFAVNNYLTIDNKDGIKKISSKILKGEKVTVYVDGYENDFNEITSGELIISNNQTSDISISKNSGNGLLNLIPKEYVLGIGCKKDTDVSLIEKAVESKLTELNIDIKDIAAITSIDLKKKEKGLLKYASLNHLPFITYSQEELKMVEGDFEESSFVKEITGVGNVCERSAVKFAGEDYQVICHKTLMENVTVAIVKRKIRLKV